MCVLRLPSQFYFALQFGLQKKTIVFSNTLIWMNYCLSGALLPGGLEGAQPVFLNAV